MAISYINGNNKMFLANGQVAIIAKGLTVDIDGLWILAERELHIANVNGKVRFLN